MLKRIKAIPRKLIATSKVLASNDSIVLNWATEGIIAKNWGDKLNPYLVERVSGRKVVFRANIYPLGDISTHYCIGSHLASACKDSKGVVWGAGFISEDIPILGQPRKIAAVRGWLSNERLRKAGIKPPDVVGDTALLLPRIYKPKRNLPRKALGIIPHCYEWNEPFFINTRQWENSRVIDICGDIEDVIEQIIACDRIISSSLHGIICADAYGIPAIWLHASDKPKGDGFKFRDYFSSVGRPDLLPILVNEKSTRAALEDKFFEYKINIDLDLLWKSCPFLSETSK